MQPLTIAFFGSSLVSAYWNGAATYYRGIVKALAQRGHKITFYEPDAYDRQAHRDMADPAWAQVIVYGAKSQDDVCQSLERAESSDVIIKFSGVGVWDQFLEREIAGLSRSGRRTIFWDVDAPATLERIYSASVDPLRDLVPSFDLICTYGGGQRVVSGYEALGAKKCVPIYNAADPSTHYRVPPEPRFCSDLAFLGNRLPDREARVEEFFLRPAATLTAKTFLLGGNGWDTGSLAYNVAYCGHVYTRDHNAFNSSAGAVLNVDRESMAAYGYSPPTRIFEAAAAASCIITDEWHGIEMFLEPGREVLVARDGEHVVEHLRALRPARQRAIGEAAQQRILASHTYSHRIQQIEAVLENGGC